MLHKLLSDIKIIRITKLNQKLLHNISQTNFIVPSVFWLYKDYIVIITLDLNKLTLNLSKLT